ncbi:hypothetical protein A3C59_02990 [Candidatus Daviesbacteria bacterium RIFCSPHIGHO2_02_FULL_36_13]|uniref:Uncharacterized protein n=1 Tax=Candidatus Daviesbacteria bacterium RIFCSPHIGHO2_02_FULL_36_13 TaxID=1797768 RepID=A0A1F5JSC2_9BACT|nr:MAG: hypothetical protein A3C59_02990 [Candidatus Daviesbacteria bacterium RIFCSPHIGHO2_02_FULL_36_13]
MKEPVLLAEVKIGDYFGFSGPNYTSLGQATSQLVGPIFSIATFVVILYFLLGSFKYMKAGGNKEDVESARMMILHAIIGFIILMFAFLILQFVLSNLFEVTDFQLISKA